MSTPCDRTRKDALLRGAATVFDLSGTGVFPLVTLPSASSTEEDLEALRKDLEAIGSDLMLVFRSELKSVGGNE